MMDLETTLDRKRYDSYGYDRRGMLPNSSHDGPSPHLSFWELRCRDEWSNPYPEAWRQNRARILAAAFEDLRDNWALPIPVLSGYRTRAHNRAVGGSARSQHVEGLALDLAPPRGVTLQEFHRAALGEARKRGSLIRGVGLYAGFLHIDCRESLHLVVWRGARVKAEVA
jgi:hypothetical protein